MENVEYSNATEVEMMVREVMTELQAVHSGKYEMDKAKKTAALALRAQMDLAQFLSDLEGRAKTYKVSTENVESETYFEARQSGSDKKLSEATLQHMVSGNKKVFASKVEAINAEQDYKKWYLVLNTLKDAHIFFRNLGNGKNEWNI